MAWDNHEPSLHVGRGSVSISCGAKCHAQSSDVEFGSCLTFYCERLAGANVSLPACLRCLLSMAVCWKLQAWSAAMLFNVLQLVCCASVIGCSRCWTAARGADHTLARVFCGAIRQREFRKYQAGIRRSVGVCFLSPLVSTQALTLCFWYKAEFESFLKLLFL